MNVSGINGVANIESCRTTSAFFIDFLFSAKPELLDTVSISGLPISIFMELLLLLLMPHIPVVTASPEEKRNDGERQAEGEV